MENGVWWGIVDGGCCHCLVDPGALVASPGGGGNGVVEFLEASCWGFSDVASGLDGMMEVVAGVVRIDGCGEELGVPHGEMVAEWKDECLVVKVLLERSV